MNVYTVRYRTKWENDRWENDERSTTAKDIFTAIDKVRRSVMKETWTDDERKTYKRIRFIAEEVIKEISVDV